MDIIKPKSKLVFFQYRYDDKIPEFLLVHMRDHVKCLAEFFDVTVINKDCDYIQICDMYEPDLTLFESAENHNCQKPKITNTHSYPHIPKIGLLNIDSFSGSRAGSLSAMDHWGIETFFSICLTAAENTPEIAENLFVWPNFVDPEVYRDYGVWKSIPVLLTGNMAALYPWRRKVSNRIAERFPSLLCPHPGYHKIGSNLANSLVGEKYAKTINASIFVPTCGTVAREIVRKHFEIPACRSCLVTEKSPALEAAGYIDMQNCVFADEHDVLDKLDYLFHHLDKLEDITNAGHHLVHSRHTMKRRDEIRQWFDLYSNLRQDQKIVQNSPFEPLAVVSKSNLHKHFHVKSNGIHLSFLHQGNEKLQRGRYDEAEHLYLKCLNYLVGMPEAKLGLTLCNLHKGNAKMALYWIEQPIFHILEEYKSMDPDPVEWAYYIISLLCLGKLDDAIKLARQFTWLHHTELDRTRWAVNVLGNRGETVSLSQEGSVKQRWTIHPMPYKNFNEWIGQLCIMLKACGQHTMADILKTKSAQYFQSISDVNKNISSKQEKGGEEKNKEKEKYVFLPNDMSNFFKRRVLFGKTKTVIKGFVAGLLHRLEVRYGGFLPYQLSNMRNDEFFALIRKLAREENINTALIIGAVAGKCSTEAFMAGVSENENKPSLFCVSVSKRKRQFFGSKWAHTNNFAVKWYELTPNSLESIPKKLEEAVKRIKQDNKIVSFDALLIDNSTIKYDATAINELSNQLHETRFVFLEDINNALGHKLHIKLFRDLTFNIIAHDPSLRNGYAIFKKDSYTDQTR